MCHACYHLSDIARLVQGREKGEMMGRPKGNNKEKKRRRERGGIGPWEKEKERGRPCAGLCLRKRRKRIDRAERVGLGRSYWACKHEGEDEGGAGSGSKPKEGKREEWERREDGPVRLGPRAF